MSFYIGSLVALTSLKVFARDMYKKVLALTPVVCGVKLFNSASAKFVQPSLTFVSEPGDIRTSTLGRLLVFLKHIKLA